MTDFSTMRTICFTGPRPNKLYGYKNKEKYQKLVDCIHDFLRGFCRIESDEILTVITGEHRESISLLFGQQIH